ncbi:MAG: hypothetical protein AAB790_02855 [Patescibacteria group bacterium]
MEWLRTHPYTSAIGAAVFLVLVGTYVVVSRASQPEGTRPTSWGGEAVPFLDPTSYAPAAGSSREDGSIMQQVQNSPPYTYIAPNFVNTAPPDEDNSDSYDFDAFIAELTRQSSVKADTSGEGSQSAYTYIPRGLISTTTSRSTRSALQQELYDYGNDIGSTIESFEQQHSNTVQILKVQVEDRADPEKAAAVVKVGRDFEELGKLLLQMDPVPSTAATAHEALAQSYIGLGKKLALVPGAERDADYIKAIEAYNASADIFVQNYVRLVALFGVYSVTFTSVDGGKIFTFNPGGF